MFSLKARDITKSVVVAIIASILCGYIFIPLLGVLLVEAVLAIEKAWGADCRSKALLVIYGMDAAELIAMGVAGFLMGVLISFILKSSRILTTILALLSVTLIYVIYILVLVPSIPQDLKTAVLIRLSIRYLLDIVFFWGCGFLGVWLVSRRKRKKDKQSLPGGELKTMPQP